MADPAHEETEKIIRAIEIRINNEYAQAEKEVQAKIDDYLERFKKKDETWATWVADVKDTDPKEYKKRLSDYKKWRTSQIAIGKRWKELKQTLAEDLHNANLIARSIATGYMPEIYALNHNYGTYTVESGAMKDTSYTLYDRQSVERLFRDNSDILPPPGKALAKKIQEGLDAGKDIRWNRQQLQSVMIQAILQGESIPKIATRLANTVGDKNRKAAIRNARTMATGAQNAGRIDSFKRAERMGIKMKQQWLSTLDNRTRHSHRLVDHEVQPVGEKFSNGCRFPGDPEAPAAEVYNCRCSLRGLVDGLEPKARELRDLSEIGDYEEWKNGKVEPNPITLPEEKAEAIRQAEIAKYRRMAGETGGATKTAETSAKTSAEKTTDALENAYEYHRTKNGLNVVPLAEQTDIKAVSVSYKNLSDETAEAFEKTISALSEEYDTTLQTIRTMTRDEALGNTAFAKVGHNYEVDNSEMLINPVKCKDASALADKIKEHRKSGYCINVQEGKELEYVPTHEFAHTLINMKDPLNSKRNWVDADYDKVKTVRKEIEGVYTQYLAEVKPLEEKASAKELEFLETLNMDAGNKAQEFYKELRKVKLSDYSLNNSDEFMAEAFTQAKIGTGDNKYSNMVMEIINRYFKR